MPTTIYRCQKCKCEYDSYLDAENCEASHPEPVAVKTVQYTVMHTPYAVEVTFDNGTKRIFNDADMSVPGRR